MPGRRRKWVFLLSTHAACWTMTTTCRCDSSTRHDGTLYARSKDSYRNSTTAVAARQLDMLLDTSTLPRCAAFPDLPELVRGCELRGEWGRVWDEQHLGKKRRSGCPTLSALLALGGPDGKPWMAGGGSGRFRGGELLREWCSWPAAGCVHRQRHGRNRPAQVG